MKEFTFSVPQKITVGEGSLKKLPQISREQGGTHAFIISGPHLTRMGVVDTCAEILTEAGIPVSTFTETEGNPSVQTVDAAVAKYKESGADYIIALGGGSPMDVAKAVGVVAKFGGSITEYEGGGKVPGDIPPLIAIPTTAGTGSEVTAFSVITDHERNYKLTVSSEKLIPSAAILDADLLTTAPASVAASCGVDALVHAIEAYLSKAASPFSDAMAEKALSMLGENICSYVADRANVEAAENMLVGSLFAGIAFSSARLGDVHAMSHPVSAYYNVPHGVANAILLPFVMEYNALADRGKYLKIYNAISDISEYPDTFVPHMLVRKLRQINQKLGIPESLSEVGVTEEHFDAMADDAMKSGNIAVNPRSTGKGDILVLYRKAL
jgi:alcohol dehydrogenase